MPKGSAQHLFFLLLFLELFWKVNIEVTAVGVDAADSAAAVAAASVTATSSAAFPAGS